MIKTLIKNTYLLVEILVFTCLTNKLYSFTHSFIHSCRLYKLLTKYPKYCKVNEFTKRQIQKKTNMGSVFCET